MKPNILIIHADQHRQDCIGAYGNRDIKTPNIDALAQNGTLYNSHYTVYPVCTPSRYSFFSGQYVHQHNAWTNISTLPNGTATFPKLLKAAGYRTCAVGKMHFTPAYQDIGFDKMVLSEQNGEGRFEDDYHSYLMENGLIDKLDLADQVDDIRKTMGSKYYDHFGAFQSDLSVESHSTSWVTRQAAAELDGWDEAGGSLLFVGYIKPHHPFDPPFPYSKMYNENELKLLAGYTEEIPKHDFDNSPGFFDNRLLSEEKLRGVMAKYYATITQIDDNVGELISILKRKGCYDNTVIIYTSDHGDYMGYHHMLLKGNYLYEPLAKIPLIIKYPNQKEGIVDDSLSENVDLASTILELCGISAPCSMSGNSLLDKTRKRDYAFSEGQYGTEAAPCQGYMIRTKRYKLIVHGSFESSMFFDLEKDPYELKNVANSAEYQEEFDRHKNYLIEHMLFQYGGRNHCDNSAPQLKDSDKLAEKSRRVKEYVAKRAYEIKTAEFQDS